MSYDFIGPKNGPAVVINSALLTPTVTTHNGADTLTLGFVITMQSYQIGKMVTVSVEGLTFAGAAKAAVTNSWSTTQLPTPLLDFSYPIIINVNHTKTECTMVLGANRELSFYAGMNSQNFGNGDTEILYPFVFQYIAA